MSEQNLEDLSIEQLREMAIKQSITPAEEPAAEAEEKPRDEKGRFAKAEPEPEEEVIYERTIDLGDGAGVQVFRGKSYDELIDNLAKAQENATRKIREQAAELKTKREQATQAVEEDETLTEEQKYILSQKILTDPMAVIEHAVESRLKKFKRAEEAAKAREEAEAQAVTKAAEDFMQQTPDYYASKKNGAKILRALELEGLDATIENFQRVYQDLNESGLLEGKPEEKQVAEQEEVEAQPERIAPRTETTVVRRKVVGGSPLSAKRSAPAPEKTSGPTEEDLAKLSTAELQQLAYKYAMDQQ